MSSCLELMLREPHWDSALFLNDRFSYFMKAADTIRFGAQTMTNGRYRFWKLPGADGQFKNLLCC